MTLPTKDELLAAAREMSSVCEHGQLRRQCPHCDVDNLESELSALRKENEALRNIITGMRRCVQEAVTARALLAKEKRHE